MAMKTQTESFEIIDFATIYQKEMERLNAPTDVVVSSGSEIKINAVREALKVLMPKREFSVHGIAASSEINEQPVGEETEKGAKNRLRNAEKEWKRDHTETAMFVSIENGLFEEHLGDEKRWTDKSVVVIKTADGKEYSFVSGGVIFPEDAVMATMAKGENGTGFVTDTVGKTLLEMGKVINKQDPHSDLTNGAFTRNQQMTGAIIGCLVRAGKES